MSSRYNGRHRNPGRHRGSAAGLRIPRTFRSGFALPTAAAAALVLTATGATVAQSSPVHLDPTGLQQTKAKAQDATLERAELTARRQQQEMQAAAVAARAEEIRRVSRDRARAAVAKEVAKKKAEQARQKALAKAEAERKARAKMWVMPIRGATFTSPYGSRWGRLHAGNDFAAPVGTPLVAMSSGTVVFAGYDGGYGNKVEVRFWDGTVAWYAHMNSISARVGAQVSAGDQLGTSGNTGNSTGPHLHLEIHPNGGGAIDPAGWMASRGLGR